MNAIDDDGFQLPKKSRKHPYKAKDKKQTEITIDYTKLHVKERKPRKDKNISIKNQTPEEKLMSQIDWYVEKIHEYTFYKESVNTLKDFPGIHDIYVLGIGNLSTSTVSIWQFAYILALKQDLHIETTINLFDPTFNNLDILIFSSYGCTIETQNKMGKYPITTRTLFYLPHCGSRLNSNIFWSNWGESLKNIIYIGNSFKRVNYLLEHTMHEEDNTYTIPPLIPYFYEYTLEMKELKEENEMFNSFHGTGIHYITEEQYQKLIDNHLLESTPEECFDDKEVILPLSVDLQKYKDYCDTQNEITTKNQ
ncbi:hypothetical protein WA158_000509 [Blastocystis sp. Blastoise]